MPIFPHTRQTVLSAHARDALDALPADMIRNLDPKVLELVVDAFQALDVTSAGQHAPKLFQVQTAVALWTGRNVMVTAGCGEGKTKAMELPIMGLDPHKLAITLVPLKLLQRNHLAAFDKQGIKSLIVNQDTKHDAEVWKALMQGKSTYQNIFCAPEQFRILKGHVPRLAALLKVPAFVNSIALLLIDEGHFIETDGQPHGKEAAHRPAYGTLGDLRSQLPLLTPCAVFSATLPPHVKAFIRADLGMNNTNTLDISLPTNRPNIMQAVIPLVGNLNNLANLDFLAPIPFRPPMAPLARGVVFIDHKLSTAAITDRLNARCPPGLRETRPFRHLHSGMSQDYIDSVYQTFKEPDSPIRKLITTAAASHGLDVPDLTEVVMYGVPKTLIEFRQRKGRIGRTPGVNSICLTIAEDWACKPTLIDGRKVGSKENWTEAAMIDYASCSGCLRKFVMDYSGERGPNSLHFTTDYCCGGHQDGFRLQDYFAGPMLTASETKTRTKKPRAMYRRYRPVPQREELEGRLLNWARLTHLDSPVSCHWPQDWILPNASAKLLAREPHRSLSSPSKITIFLQENQDWEDNWADIFYSVISQFDDEIAAATKAFRPGKKLAAPDESDELGPESEDELEHGFEPGSSDVDMRCSGDTPAIVESPPPTPVVVDSGSRSLRRRRADTENGESRPVIVKSPPQKKRRVFATDTTNIYSNK